MEPGTVDPDGAPFDPKTAWTEPPGARRILLVGIVVGVIASFVAVTAAILADGQELASAIGLGLFIAFWGGLGFGAMVGGVVFVSRLEAEQSGH